MTSWYRDRPLESKWRISLFSQSNRIPTRYLTLTMKKLHWFGLFNQQYILIYGAIESKAWFGLSTAFILDMYHPESYLQAAISIVGASVQVKKWIQWKSTVYLQMQYRVVTMETSHGDVWNTRPFDELSVVYSLKLISPWTKCHRFGRRNFQLHFLEWKW